MSGAVSGQKQAEYFANEKKAVDRILPDYSASRKKRLWKKADGLSGHWPPFSTEYPHLFLKRLGQGLFTQIPDATAAVPAQKICPVNNITMNDSKPFWQHNCEQCYACIQWCPRQAIQINKKTASRERYHHPEITLKDMLR